jgi:F0F1-type ATP synthase delta subunit
LVDSSIIVQDRNIQSTGLIKDLSQLDFNKLSELLKEDDKYIQLQRTEDLIKKKIEDLIQKRPQIGQFKKRLEQIMDQYNLNNVDIQKTFEALIQLAHELDEEQKSEIES